MSLFEAIQKVDAADMLGKVLDMAAHFERAWDSNQEISLDYDPSQIHNITIAGMGGSAISGDVLRCLKSDEVPVAIMVNRHYELANYVNKHSLVFVSSYSGNTEETVAAFEAAHNRGAQIICITGGGKIKELAGEWGYPVYSLPGGFPPRAALVFLTVPLLQALFQLRLIENPEPQIKETVNVLKTLTELYHPKQENEHNIPALIADNVSGKVPVIYAGTGLLEAAAIRWRGQFSENAEILAYGNLFPEMNHNEIVGWGLQKELDRSFQVIYLRDHGDHPRIKLRMDIIRSLIEETSNPVLEIWSEGESPVARLFSIIFTGDLASVFLAAKLGVDPTPVKKIDYLKSTLSRQ